MRTNHSPFALPFGTGGLVVGLLLGLLGSYSDDLLGGAAGTVVQIGLWAVSGAFLLSGALALTSSSGPRGGNRAVPSR